MPARRSLLDPPGRRAPEREGWSLLEAIETGYAAAMEPDSTAKRAILAAMRSKMGVIGDEHGDEFHVPDHMLSRGGPAGLLQRTQGEGFGGALGGFAVKPQWSTHVADRARQSITLLDFLRWKEVDSLEYYQPAAYETSRVSGKRYGGVTSQWGVGEAVTPAPSDGKLSLITFRQNRLMTYTQASRDLFSDAEMIPSWLYYQSLAELRASTEQAVISGPQDVSGGSLGPQGITQSACCVTVSKGSTSSGLISAQKHPRSLASRLSRQPAECDLAGQPECNRRPGRIDDHDRGHAVPDHQGPSGRRVPDDQVEAPAVQRVL